jgi:hypothetical protein
MASQKNILENGAGTFGNCRGLDIWQAANSAMCEYLPVGTRIAIKYRRITYQTDGYCDVARFVSGVDPRF